ncbi:hypothetical protein OAK49_02095, partial [Euryarchaeota archaeon]|nr:hypothetical protein [Euryarchaeota archaeon]
MTVATAPKASPKKFGAAFAVLILLAMSLSPLAIMAGEKGGLDEESTEAMSSGIEPWSDGGQAWPQPGRTPGRISTPPQHVHSTESGG